MSEKENEEDLRPWEREEEKKKPERGDGIPPRTGLSARVRSKPRAEGQENLNMSILMKETEPTEKYGNTLHKRQKRLLEEWKEVTKEMKKIEEIAGVEPNGESAKGRISSTGPGRKGAGEKPANMKTLDWSY